MLSFGAKKKTQVPMDDSNFSKDPITGKWTYNWPDGFFIGTEDDARLCQEIDKGLELEWAQKAVYREKPTSSGRKTVRQRYVISDNPQTTPQMENRWKFGDGVAAWQILTMTEQIIWNKLKYPYHMSGYNRFLRAYMRDEI